MSEITTDRRAPYDWTSEQSRRRVRRRYAADRRLQALGLGAIGIALLLLGTLFVSIISSGYKAFVQTHVQLEVFVDPSVVDAENPRDGNFRKLVRDSFYARFPDVTDPADQRDLREILSSSAHINLRNYVVSNPDLIGTTTTVKVPVSDPFDQLYKNVIPRRIEALSWQEENAFEAYIVERGLVTTRNGESLVRLDVFLDPSTLDPQDPSAGDYRGMLSEAMRALIPARAIRDPIKVLSDDAVTKLRDFVAANPERVGGVVEDFEAPLAEDYATLARGEEPTILNPRFSSAEEFDWFDSLIERGLISSPFNWALITNGDSRFPEQAGLAGAIVGSALTLLVTLLISFPVGVAAAVYLEEFAPKNRTTDLIEVNINNLAAVPSVVFGLLGLALFLGTFGMPRSTPLVGGMVLSLMTLPTIIIATRAALKAVPPSIREAALGVGASKHQVIMHHVLPLAMPGILTGTIIGLAQALGETAPLLLVGMNAFITTPPSGILDPATALPAQIYSWADSPERGFTSRTSAAILVLLTFLILMNAVAIILRQRLERKW